MGIQHVRLDLPSRFSTGWWLRQIDKLLSTSLAPGSRVARGCASAADATLQIGGDNYTLDYGYPLAFMEIDQRVFALGKPIALWGASVGPFDADPGFRDAIAAHLQRFDAILVRERRSEEILRRMGIEWNVSRMTDPAFVMESVEPEAEKLGFDVPAGAVGLNLSPLMAKYVTGGDLKKWTEIGAEIVNAILRTLDRPVVLVPHVTSPNPENDDGTLLRSISASLPRSERANVYVVGDDLSAAETKWLISRCALFAGARTHSTIAAISSAVPTVCFAYSTKARGLAEAVYGSTDYCVEPEYLTPEGVSTAMTRLDSQAHLIRNTLKESLPDLFEGCFAAGQVIREAVARRSNA